MYYTDKKHIQIPLNNTKYFMTFMIFHDVFVVSPLSHWLLRFRTAFQMRLLTQHGFGFFVTPAMKKWLISITQLAYSSDFSDFKWFLQEKKYIAMANTQTSFPASLLKAPSLPTGLGYSTERSARKQRSKNWAFHVERTSRRDVVGCRWVTTWQRCWAMMNTWRFAMTPSTVIVVWCCPELFYPLVNVYITMENHRC